MRSRLLTVSVVVFVALAGCRSPGPVFTVPTHVDFVVGTQISTSDLTNDFPDDDYTGNIVRTVRWAATGRAGCEIRYEVQQTLRGGDNVETLVDDYAGTEFLVTHHTYDGSRRTRPSGTPR